MMSVTHAVLGVTSASLFLGSADPVVLTLAAIATQFPDIDTSKSIPGRILFPISRYLEKRYPHRSVTHSFLATAIFAAIALPIVLLGPQFYHALVIGFFMGWFGDVFTKSGVAAFFPNPARLVIPGNPRLRLSTNSNAERFVLGALVIVAIASINISSSGGILRAFNQSLGIPAGAVEIVNTEGNKYQMIARIQGRHAITQESVDQDFLVIRPMNQSDLLAVSRDRLMYRVGETSSCQIIATRVLIRRGRPIKARSEQLQLSEEAIADVVGRLPAQAQITGTLTLADGEDLSIPNHQDRFDPITVQRLQGGSVILNLESANPGDLIRWVGDYDASGSLLVRVVEVL